MIRPIAAKDRPQLLSVAEASGLFEPAELEVLAATFDEALAGDESSERSLWLGDEEGGALQCVAYCGAEAMTDRVWNLYLIAVRPELQGKGLGAAMIQFVERALRDRAQRMLIVETAGLPEFEPQRAFYRKCGYEQEGAVRDFYADGVDKVVFRKLLEPPQSAEA